MLMTMVNAVRIKDALELFLRQKVLVCGEAWFLILLCLYIREPQNSSQHPQLVGRVFEVQ